MSEGMTPAQKKKISKKVQYWAKKDDPSQDYRAKLQSAKESVDIGKVGLINIIHPKGVPAELFDACKRYGIAQAKLDKLSFSEDMLCIRNIFPDLDFVNSAREKITKREWVQPRSLEEPYSRFSGYWDIDEDNQIYYYSKASGNRRKVMIIYGIKNLKYNEKVGGIQANAGGSPAEICSTSAKFTRHVNGQFVKVLDIPDLNTINDEGLIWFDTPFLFKRGDDMAFYLRPKNDAGGRTDHLMLLGMIIEPLGTHVVG